MAAPDSRRLFLVRHGETEGQSSVRYYGQTDLNLSALGREQVLRTAPLLAESLLAEANKAVLVSSPMRRARQSAELVAAHLGRTGENPYIVDEFIEVDFGEIEGLTAEEIRQKIPDWYSRWQAGAIDGFPGGESFADFDHRIGQGVDRLLTDLPGQNLLVMAHKGVVAGIIRHLLSWTRDQTARLSIELASLSILRFDGDEWSPEIFDRLPD